MIKIGSAQIAAVSARGASLIRELAASNESLSTENGSLREKIASMEREEEIKLLAAEMDEKGLNADLTFEEKVAHIRKHRDLSQVQEAVKMASAGHIRLVSVTDEPGRGSVDSFTGYLLGGGE